jgi:hypothetical protein
MLATLFEDEELARRGREAREWLARDEHRRVIGLVLASLAISIAVSLLAFTMIGAVERRRRRAGAAAGSATAAEVGGPDVEPGPGEAPPDA